MKLNRDQAIERRLREEAASVRRPVPDGVRESILDQLARAQGSAKNGRRLRPARWGLAAAAAACAAAIWLADPLRSPVEPVRAPPAASLAGAPPVSLEGVLASVFAVTPARLGASVEKPLLTEMHNLARDTRGIARTLVAGIPAPIQELIGLSALR